MDDEPITAAPVEEPGAQSALPEEQQENAAALAAPEQKDDQQGDASASVPEVDDKLQSFAKGLGIEDVSSLSERELKLLKVAKDNQAEFQRTAQKASSLEKTITDASKQVSAGQEDDVIGSLQSTVNSLLIKDQVNTFFASEGIDQSMRPKMAELVDKDPTLGALVEGGHLSLANLYNMARGADSEAIKSQGGKEALQQLANKTIAKAVPGSATTSNLSSEKKDAFTEAFNAA